MDEKPAIIVVDDEADALAGIREALTRRFGGDYRILPHLAARTALEAVCSIKEKEEEIADEAYTSWTSSHSICFPQELWCVGRRRFFVTLAIANWPLF
jgi:hypothetical protein